MKAIQRKITIIIWICSVLMTLVAIIVGYDTTSTVATIMFSISIITTVIYFIPFSEQLKAIIVLLLVGCGCLGTSIALGGSAACFAASYLVLGMAILFFDPVVLLGYSLVYIPASLLAFLISPKYIVGEQTASYIGMFELITYAVMTWCLYIGTKTGSRIMQSSIKDEQEAQEKSAYIEQMAKLAHQNAFSLYENISDSNQIVGTLSDDAEKANDNIIMVKNSEDETIELFHALNKNIHTSTEWIEENYEIIDALKDNFETALTIVKESMTYSSNASQALNDILSTIQDAHECIIKSSKETEEIETIMKDINEIASRTNLLAINASIEAARVGDKGRGFHIVAEQIRTLSVQSKQASENINSILKVLSQALNATDDKVNQGLAAIKQGIGNLNHIVQGLDTINVYSNQSQDTLIQEMEVYEKIKKEFKNMVSEVNRSMEIATHNMTEINKVAETVQTQTNRTVLASNQLRDMKGLANQITEHFA